MALENSQVFLYPIEMVLELGEKDAQQKTAEAMQPETRVGHSRACMPGERMPVTKDQEIHLDSHHH